MTYPKPQSPWPGLAIRVLRAAISDRISLNAAGCAFYATLSLFPAISLLISVYGLVFAPGSVAPQLRLIQRLLPPLAFQLISQRVETLVTRPAQTLSLGLLISLALGLWSASSGTRAMLWALNVAFDLPETRGMVRFQATVLTITCVLIMGTVIALGLLLAVPLAVGRLGVSAAAGGLIQGLSFLVLLAFVLLGLALLYHFGPAARRGAWRWVSPGTLVATLCWLVASVLFSLYVAHLARYGATYGPIGAAVAVMGWFYVSAFAVLLGAELDAELA